MLRIRCGHDARPRDTEPTLDAFRTSVRSVLAVAACVLVAGCLSIFGSSKYPKIWMRHTGIVLDVGQQGQWTAKFQAEFLTSIDSVVGGAWWTADSAVLSVDPNGAFTAIAPGRVIVWVEYDGVKDSGTVRVRAAGEQPVMRWRSVSVGQNAVCALTTDGDAYCWGEDYWGAIGDGVRRQWTLAHTPVRIPFGEPFEEIQVGGQGHVCGLTRAGAAYCWGDASVVARSKSEFDATQGSILSPVRVRFDQPFVQLSAGGTHVCGLDEGGAAYCWGMNFYGQVGDGTIGIDQHRYEPTAVKTHLRFHTVVPGGSHTCAISTSEDAYCWGSIFSPELDAWLEVSEPHPVHVDRKFRFLTAGSGGHNCGITISEVPVCWGANSYLKIGVLDQTWISGELVHGWSYAQLSAGTYHTCGLRADGAAFCWGADMDGNLGSGQTTTDVCGIDQYPCIGTPLPVAGGLQFTQLSAGGGFYNVTCGVTVDDAIYCWGSNRAGMLGNGSLEELSGVPVRVADPM